MAKKRVRRSQARYPREQLPASAELALLRRDWNARVGTHFIDAASDRIRELDVWAEKTSGKQTIRVLCSAKGFPADHVPVVYSLGRDHVAMFKPSLLSFRSGSRGIGRIGADIMRGGQAASFLLGKEPFVNARPAVGLDTVKIKDDDLKKSPPIRKGDREIFDALDNALKASVFWNGIDHQVGKHARRLSSVTVPLVVTSEPFWDVPIDGGKPGTPQLRQVTYGTSLYPIRTLSNPGFPQAFTWLMCAFDALPTAIRAVDSLLEWMSTEMIW